MHRNGLDSTKKSYKNDILLILFFLIIGIGAFAFMQLQGKRGAEVKVSVNNKEYGTSYHKGWESQYGKSRLSR